MLTGCELTASFVGLLISTAFAAGVMAGAGATILVQKMLENIKK